MRIVAKDLTYVYNQKTEFSKTAIDSISLEIDTGEFFGIIGHTGSGKSTFVQHLNALIPVQSGSLTVGGVRIKMLSRKEFKAVSTADEENSLCYENGKKVSYRKYVKRYRSHVKGVRAKVGMVFQYPEYQLFGETVFADVAFGLKNFYPDYTAEQVESAVRNAIERVGLDYQAVKDVSPFDLSGGQKRRVAIAGVIVTEPKVLVLDEPVAGLDPQGKKELMALLHSLKQSVCETIIIVSHDMDEVAENCTTVAVFSEGKLVAKLPPKQLFANRQMLEDIGLDVPLTASVASALKNVGVTLDTDYTTDSFIAAIINEYKNK